jgi:DNA-binding PadR family transcriptional regulator
MGKSVDLRAGTLDVFSLEAVSLGPLHGYAILLRINQISNSAPTVQQGALYPALYRLDRQRLLAGIWGTSDHNRRAKFYRPTAGAAAADRRDRQLEPTG